MFYFLLNIHLFLDIDECLNVPSPCDANAVCTNTPGSYTCGPCNPGYTGTGYSVNGGVGCTGSFSTVSINNILQSQK